MEKACYIRYRRGEEMIEKKAGRQFQDYMPPAKASKYPFRQDEEKRANQRRAQGDGTGRKRSGSRTL
ncbi:MAG: hypothetical protein ACP5IL_01010 [Syntrophobacteraceae bacterium]